MDHKVVITAALTGAATRKEQNPNVPYTKEEFVAEAVKCYENGAAVVHLHARDPKTGMPTPDIEIAAGIVEGIRERCPILINVSTAIGVGVTKEQRIAPIAAIKPDMASLNTGTMNFSLADHKTGEIIFDFVFENTFDQIRKYAKIMTENGVKPELECYDIGHIHNILLLQKKGILEEPLHFNFVFGVAGGIRFLMDYIVAMKNSIPKDATWCTCGVGPNSFQANMAAIVMGGHLRVGLEDNLYIRGKELAKGSWEQVAKAADMARMLDRELATPDEARIILNLPTKKADSPYGVSGD
ncbi:MAG: 3-keto-5-aminohexanoate cleavage protein [bacterium]